MAQIPATLPISLSQITTEFGGTSLRTAANNAGLPAGAVSFSTFAGLSANEGSGSFLAGTGTTGAGFSIIFGTFGTWNSAYMPNSLTLQAMYQSATTLTIRAPLGSSNTDATFSTVTINGVTLNRSAAGFSNSGYLQWTWSGFPAGTIVTGQTYEPLWRTA